MTPKPDNPTREEQQAALEHVFYEVRQLNAASLIQMEADPVRFSLIESTLLHARALLGFYESTQRRKDDILAKDFDFDAKKITISANDRERLNKDLAHLTYSRTKRAPEEWPWDLNQVVMPILERSKDFLEHLLKNWLLTNDNTNHQECRTLLQNIENRLRP